MTHTRKHRRRTRSIQRGGFLDWLSNTFQKAKEGTSGLFSGATSSLSSGWQSVTDTLNKDITLSGSSSSSTGSTPYSPPAQAQPQYAPPQQTAAPSYSNGVANTPTYASSAYSGGRRRSRKHRMRKTRRHKRKSMRGGGYASVSGIKTARPTYYIK